tara:strand:- start:39 stop:224 length:186 start_codon:yes stop_codon:yes gene_type:complete
MNITNAQYITTINQVFETSYTSIAVTIDGVEVVVPEDPNNMHYAEILRQVEAGDLTIADAD